MSIRTLPAVGLALLALATGGCGTVRPAAPASQTGTLDSATGGIANACGQAYQVTAFPRDHRADLSSLEATAAPSARQLASVYRMNPRWTYKGQPLGTVVDDAVDYLEECGLHRTAGLLSRLTGRP